MVNCLILSTIKNTLLQLFTVAQWVARPTRDRWIPVSREFEPHQRPQLFPCARNFILIAKYLVVPGTDSSMIYISKIVSQSNKNKLVLTYRTDIVVKLYAFNLLSTITMESYKQISNCIHVPFTIKVILT